MKCSGGAGPVQPMGDQDEAERPGNPSTSFQVRSSGPCIQPRFNKQVDHGLAAYKLEHIGRPDHLNTYVYTVSA